MRRIIDKSSTKMQFMQRVKGLSDDQKQSIACEELTEAMEKFYGGLVYTDPDAESALTELYNVFSDYADLSSTVKDWLIKNQYAYAFLNLKGVDHTKAMEMPFGSLEEARVVTTRQAHFC